MNQKERGAAFLIPAAIVALVGILGYFAVPRVVADIKQRHATAKVVAAEAEQAKADHANQTAQTSTGRGIQRETTQAIAALTLLSASPQRDFSLTRLGNVLAFSAQLYGNPEAADVAQWQRLAFNAFSETAAVRATAEKEIAAQQATINETIHQLQDAQRAKETADARAARAVQNLQATQKRLDETNGALALIRFAVTCVAVLFVAGVILSLLAGHFPQFGAAATVVHSVIAPGAAVLLAKAKAETATVIDRTGQLFGRIRSELPQVAGKLREMGNGVYDEIHKAKIGDIADAAHKDFLAAKHEAVTLLNPDPKP